MQQQTQDEPEGLTVQIIHWLAMDLPTESRLDMHTAMDMHSVCMCGGVTHSELQCITHWPDDVYDTYCSRTCISLSHTHIHTHTELMHTLALI